MTDELFNVEPINIDKNKKKIIIQSVMSEIQENKNGGFYMNFKRIFFTGALALILAFIFVGTKSIDKVEAIKLGEIEELNDGIYVDVTIPKDDYEVGDIIYLYLNNNKSAFIDYFIDTVYADEFDDVEVIAVHEITEGEVEELREKAVGVKMQLMLSEEEYEELRSEYKNLGQMIKAQRLLRNQERKQEHIKSKFAEKKQGLESNGNGQGGKNSGDDNTNGEDNDNGKGNDSPGNQGSNSNKGQGNN